MKNFLVKIIFIFIINMINSLALANIHFFILNNTSDALCDQLDGKWQGSGSVSFCTYRGEGTIQGSNNFSASMNLSTRQRLCPKEDSLTLSGVCQNGEITIHSSSMDLSGSISNDGKSIHLTGTVKVFRSANANIDLSKVS